MFPCLALSSSSIAVRRVIDTMSVHQCTAVPTAQQKYILPFHSLTHCLLHGSHVANLPCLSLTRHQSLNYKQYKRRDTGTSESSVLAYMANWQQRTVIRAAVRYRFATSKKLALKLSHAKACVYISVQDEHDRVKRDNAD